MAEFKLDFSTANDGTIADGTYEAVINNVKEDVAKTGSEFMNFDMIIRNDVDQKYQNAHVFNKVYRSKATSKYPQGMLMNIAKAAGMEDGKSYNSFEDFMNDFVGQPVKVTVKNTESEYNGQTYENLDVKRWGKTSFPEVGHQWKNKPAEVSNNAEPIKDDDLPF